jgi:hypothetical protein
MHWLMHWVIYVQHNWGFLVLLALIVYGGLTKKEERE